MNNIYETHDIVLAAVLRLEQHKLIKLRFDLSNKNRAFFQFEDTEPLKEVETKFLLGNMLLEPVRLHNEIRALTSLIRNTK